VQGKLSAKNLLNIYKTSVCAMEVFNILKKGINFLFTIKSICSICCVSCKSLLYLAGSNKEKSANLKESIFKHACNLAYQLDQEEFEKCLNYVCKELAKFWLKCSVPD